MNIIRFFKSKPKAINDNWTTDILKSEGIQQFFFAQEAIQTYRANFEVLKRREIAKEVEQTLESFLQYDFPKQERDFFIALLRRNDEKISKIEIVNQSVFKVLKKIDPSGIEILEITKDINLQLLKKLYRAASMKYHPDVGGSHDKMLKVNEAYTVFHNVLINFRSFQDTGEQVNKIPKLPKSWEDWIYSLYLVMA